MDTTYQTVVPEDSGVSTAGNVSVESLGGFGTVAGVKNAIPLTGSGAPSLTDPMELDIDIDTISWAGDLDFTVRRLEPDHLDLSIGVQNTNQPSNPPADVLFAEDESVLPSSAASSTSFDGQRRTAPSSGSQLIPAPTSLLQTQSFPVSTPGMNAADPRQLDKTLYNYGLASERLRRQLSLLSKGWAGDEIRFKNCDPTKAVILHQFAIELGLGYNHDVRTREVSMSRLDPVTPASNPQTSARRPSSSMPRSSTELDSALCLPTLPVFQGTVFAEAATPFLARHDSNSSQQPQSASQSVTAKDQNLARNPSRSERLNDSISKQLSTIKTSISKGGRRGPLSESGRRDMRALESAGGACWRCKVLRRKCDPGTPCRYCLQAVPMPHLGDDAPLWPLIGCRRGPLRDSIPPQLPCPWSRRPQGFGTEGQSIPARRCLSVDVAERCLLSAESQRLADMKAVFEGASYKLSISDAKHRAYFVAFIEAGRYRDHESLHTSYSVSGKTYTYTELIAIIAWELAENHGLLSLLEIKEWNNFMNMIETACIYESEIGQTSLVILSVICLRHCLEALRLHSAQLLTPSAHEDCCGGRCQVECIQNLTTRIAAYIDELSAVIFNKENMRDRRWWLSTFYSLYIQSYVRHALIAIEKILRFRVLDDAPTEDLAATQYLHLPTILFTAASAKYDPLFDGRLQYALTDNSVIPETTLPATHQSSARAVCEVDKWPEAGIQTPYQFLRRLLQIGSLDFFDSSRATFTTSGSRSPLTLDTSLATPGMSKSPSFCSPTEMSIDTSLSPRPFRRGHNKRDSVDSRWSAQPSTIFSSHNPSQDSLARTMSTDMTSLYEHSIFANVSRPDKVGDIDTEMCLDAGIINPAALFSPSQGLLLQRSLEQISTASQLGEVTSQPASVEAAFVCSCCPRNPRRFHTAEELAQHEAEKPHPCTQCKKRFKSPTEAERHINAIHLKSDSWSCKALENCLLAFQSETFNGVVWDVCGFCGGGFARNHSKGNSDENGVIGGDSNEATPEHKAELVSHLESVHKIGECDRNKKFYRADNFRQHLKNTHVAKPGKWLKTLERVCRTTREEEPSA